MTMRSKLVAWLVVVACPAFAQVARAEAPVPVHATAMVETDDAVWFSTAEQPQVVYYFGKTYTAFEEFSPPAGRRRFRVQERLRAVMIPENLGTLHESWAGRQALPHTLVATESCDLARTPEMVLVAQQADMRGRSFMGNSTAALCQFSFNLPREIPDAYVANLAAQAEQGTLLIAPLSLPLLVPGTLSWSSLHEAITGSGELGDATLSRQDATVVIGWALVVTPNGLSGYLQQSPTERDATIDTALATLFSKQNGRYRLVAMAPPGALSGWVVAVTVAL